MFLKSDSFAVRQSQQLIVVHNRVHILNPQRINVTIEHNVFSLAFLSWLINFPENTRKETVGPVPGDWVECSIKLDDGASFSVQCVELGWNAETAEVRE